MKADEVPLLLLRCGSTHSLFARFLASIFASSLPDVNVWQYAGEWLCFALAMTEIRGNEQRLCVQYMYVRARNCS